MEWLVHAATAMSADELVGALTDRATPSLTGVDLGLRATELSAAAPIRIVEVEAHTPFDVEAIVTIGDGSRRTLRCIVETSEPHRLDAVRLGPEPILLAAWPGVAAADPVIESSFDAETTDAVVAELVMLRNRHEVPGVSMSVVVDGSVALTAHIGLAALSPRVPVEADTVFRIGSLTKTFTAATTLLLADQHELDLMEPANTYLDGQVVEAAAGSPAITVADLLSHISGLDDAHLPVRIYRDEGEPAPTVPELYGPRVRGAHPPGSYRYANANFAMLGQLIETITGDSYASYVEERLLRPLGMCHTDFDRRTWPPEHCARGHDAAFGHLRAVPYFHVVPAAAGGCTTTPTDLGTWASELCTPHPRVLPASVRATLTNPATLHGDGLQPSLGMLCATRHATRLALHPGSLPGFSAFLVISHAHAAGVTLVANRQVDLHKPALRVIDLTTQGR